MLPIRVPDEAKQRHAPCRLVRMGPPKGVSDEDCGTAEMLRTDEYEPTFGAPAHHAYYKPTPDELAVLNAGGYLELTQIGATVQPFALNVVGA